MNWLFDSEGAYKRAPIPPGEAVLGTFTVGILKHGVSLSGAEMIVTDKHLLINPISTEGAREILKALVEVAKLPGVAEAITVYEESGLTEPIQIPRHTIKNAESSGDGGIFSAPSIRITFANGGTLDLGVLHQMLSPNIDPRNRTDRDKLLALLHSAPEAGIAAGVETSRQAASGSDIPDQIRKLDELREAGIVSNEEFEAKKKDLLERM